MNIDCHFIQDALFLLAFSACIDRWTPVLIQEVLVIQNSDCDLQDGSEQHPEEIWNISDGNPLDSAPDRQKRPDKRAKHQNNIQHG